MKLLSICIPTYNRPEKLKELNQTFLRLALNEYGDQIEIIVRDNSEDKIASINRSLLAPEVRYYKNETNVGFCGSQIRLVRDANGQFIWIISDDDLILMDGFKRLMSCLPTANEEGIDCLNLPINYRNNMGELINHKYDLISNCDIEIEKYLNNLHTVPFGYFAASVLRLNKKRLDWVEKEFQGNNILNIPLFLSMLRPESRLRFLDVPVIEYRETNHWMNIYKFYTDLYDVILFLEKEYRVNKAPLLDLAYKESLLMILIHRAGLRFFLNADDARWHLLAKLGKNINFKTLLLVIAVVLPKALVRAPFLFYLSSNHALKGNFSIGGIYSRYKLLNNFTRNNTKV
ncbi:Glycosyl transferase family 2 [uncultured archaeon]|nr:Glycosyl transferase family 2 [uncultured archaeon]